MPEMPWWLASPHLIDAILIFTLIEAAALAWWHQRTGRGLGMCRLLLMLLPGICLLLALRTSLAGAALPFVPAALAMALLCHLADLRGRWRG
ncbi:MAG TPA: hypothetical protein VFL55_15935 [Acetobacteraceae bacterium]|nr:hypothetical protein [Acetobacteraceae bacterium]